MQIGQKANKTEEIRAVLANDPAYPYLLSKTHRPPSPLYYKGVMPSGQLFPVAIVGARKMSDYGRQALERIISGLRGLPVCIVSGLAFGTDAHAHRLALEYGLCTAAILGSGVDAESIYPREHRELAENIITAGGAIISEFAAGTKARKGHFPQRNRIIAGMSACTIISEGAEGSGALITAQFALDENRDVFAIPGSVFSALSYAPHLLLRGGAKMLENAANIIEEYHQLRAIARTGPIQMELALNLSPEQRNIIAALGESGASFEELLDRTALGVSALSTLLSTLELRNEIRTAGGNFFTRNLTRANNDR